MSNGEIARKDRFRTLHCHIEFVLLEYYRLIDALVHIGPSERHCMIGTSAWIKDLFDGDYR